VKDKKHILFNRKLLLHL